MDRKLGNKVAVVTGGSAGTNYRGDNSYVTDMARQQRMERLPYRQQLDTGR